jgi:hypothetical protein
MHDKTDSSATCPDRTRSPGEPAERAARRHQVKPSLEPSGCDPDTRGRPGSTKDMGPAVHVVTCERPGIARKKGLPPEFPARSASQACTPCRRPAGPGGGAVEGTRLLPAPSKRVGKPSPRLYGAACVIQIVRDGRGRPRAKRRRDSSFVYVRAPARSKVTSSCVA